MALRLRRGTDAERQLITPVEGELIYTTDTKLLYAGDGSTAGGKLVSGSGGGGGGSTTLNALTDTDLTGATNNNVLTFNSSTNKWEPTADALGLNDLTGVSLSGTVVNGNALVYDGANWAHRPITDFFKEQQNYKINIVGDDSTVIVNTDNNTINGSTITASSGFVGSVTGNSTGYHDGDVKGSVFGDDSTVIVDAIGRRLTATQVNTTLVATSEVRAEDILDLTSETNVVRTTATGVKLVSQTAGSGTEQGPVHRTETSRGTLAAPTTVTIGDSIMSISGEGYDGTNYKTQAVINIGVSENTVGTETIPGRIDFSVRDDNGTFNTSFARLESNGIFTAPAIQSLGITTTAKNSLNAKVSGGLGLQGTIVYDTTLAGIQYYHGTDGWNNILTGNKPVETTSFIKPGVYADNTARDAAITTPTAGMMVFNSTDTKFQGYTGSAWVDLN